MITSAVDNTAFSHPPAFVSHGGELESFSRAAPEQSWNRWLDWLYTIRDDPQTYEDDMYLAPNAKVVATAINILNQLRNEATPSPPTAMMIEPNGGIIFELRHGNRTETITVYVDGSIEYDAYVGIRLVETHTLLEAQIVS
jgi:hypothetical protein